MTLSRSLMLAVPGRGSCVTALATTDASAGDRALRERHGSERDRERGSSLIELMTTVLLIGIVMGAVMAGTFSAQSAITGSDLRLQNLDQARTLMASLTKDVRTAVRLSAGSSPFTVADANHAVFYANISTTSSPKKVDLSIDSQSRLVETVWTADAGSTSPNYTYTGASTVRLVGRYVANTAAKPLFTYLDSSGNALTSVPLSATDLLAVKAVQIQLIVKKTTASILNATSLVNRVRLANLDYNAVAG
jgi:Tfp pilus assembly protein PilW